MAGGNLGLGREHSFLIVRRSEHLCVCKCCFCLQCFHSRSHPALFFDISINFTRLWYKPLLCWNFFIKFNFVTCHFLMQVVRLRYVTVDNSQMVQLSFFLCFSYVHEWVKLKKNYWDQACKLVAFIDSRGNKIIFNCWKLSLDLLTVSFFSFSNTHLTEILTDLKAVKESFKNALGLVDSTSTLWTSTLQSLLVCATAILSRILCFYLPFCSI